MFVTLEEIKDQLRIEHDNPSHDDQIERLALAAEAWTRNFLNIESLELLDDESPPASPIEIPEDVKSGILLHVEAQFYKDPALMDKLINAAISVLSPYRRSLGL